MEHGAATTPGQSPASADAVLVAIAERSEESRAGAAAEHPQSRLYADYREMLARETVDVVDVVLPTHLHHAVAKDVLESDRHLLLEKPMAPRLDHCDELIALAKARGKVLAIGHEFRISSLWGKVKELLDAGAIGEPLYALIELWRNPYRLGSEGWRYDIGRVGNWILEEPIHFFDLARWYLARCGEPVSVFAQASTNAPIIRSFRTTSARSSVFPAAVTRWFRRRWPAGNITRWSS